MRLARPLDFRWLAQVPILLWLGIGLALVVPWYLRYLAIVLSGCGQFWMPDK